MNDFITCIVHFLKICPVSYPDTACKLSPSWDGSTGSFRTGLWPDKSILKHYHLGMINKCCSGRRNAGEASFFLFRTALAFSWRFWGCLFCHKDDSQLLKDSMFSSLISSGDTASALRLGVSSGNTFQTSHADTVLHPGMAWTMPATLMIYPDLATSKFKLWLWD